MRIRYLSIIGTLLAGLSPWAFGAKTPLDQTKTRMALPLDRAPIIDGVIESAEGEEWGQAASTSWSMRVQVDNEDGDGIEGGNLGGGTKPDDEVDLGVDIFTGIVGENLYVGVRVIDDTISTDTAEAGSENQNTWQDDSVEVFIDGDNSNFPTRDTTGTNPEVVDTGGQFVITANNAYRHAEAGNPNFDPSSGWFATTKESDDGYHAEFRIPLSMIGNPKEGEHVGFTVNVNDDDDGGNAAEHILIWTGETHVEAGYGNLVIGHRRYEAVKATPPVIDGKVNDDEYPNAEVVEVNPATGVFVVGDDSVEEDNRYAWRVTHDQDAIYVGVKVWDTMIVADTAEPNSEDGRTWVDDSVEIFFDSNESNKVSRGVPADEMYDGQFVFTTNGAWRDNEANNPTYGENADWWAQSTVADDGMSYEIEFLVKKDTLVDGHREDEVMGFNININDDDAGGGRKLQLNWDGVPHFEDSYGSLVLLSAIPSDPNSVSDRSIRYGLLDQSQSRRTEQLRIRNTGESQTLTLSDAEITGDEAGVFSIVEFPESIAPGETAFATILFDSGGEKGNYSATLSYKTNDPDPTEANLTATLLADVANLAGPIARYSLDDSDGTMADVSGFGRSGEYTDVTLGQDPLIPDGTSALFSGGGHGEVQGEVFDSFIRFSISAWVNLNDLSAQQTLFAKGGGGAPTFALLSSGGNLDWFANGEPEFGAPEGTLTAGETHHVVITWDVARAAIYVDGQLVAEQDAPEEIEIVQENAFVIGSFFGSLNMNGRMDDVQFYNRAISADDALWLFDNAGQELSNVEGGGVSIAWSDVVPVTTEADLIALPVTFTPYEYPGGNADQTFFTGDGSTTGNAELDAVYNSHGWNGDGATITLDGLTAGEDFTVQLLGAGDTRGCCDTRNSVADDGNGNVSGEFERGNSSVVGTFTALSNTQDIMILGGPNNGVDPGLSAVIVTDADGNVVLAWNVGRTTGDDITVNASREIVDNPGTLPASSVDNFGGPEWPEGWVYGIRNVDLNDRTDNYDPVQDFIPFNEADGWIWTGGAWDWGDGDVPWTTVNANGGHPNGDNNNALHWAIKRWQAGADGPVEISWSIVKTNPDCGGNGGGGVTGGIYVNGEQVDTATIAGNDTDGYTNTLTVNLAAGDYVDLINSPRNTDGSDGDGCDSTQIQMTLQEGMITPGGDGIPPLENVAFGIEGGGGGVPGGDGVRARFTVPAGETADIQFSTDLLNWVTIANGISGAFVDDDAARAAMPAGYYRAAR